MNNLSQEIYARNYGVVTHEEQQKLTNAKVTVIGAGGVGGMTDTAASSGGTTAGGTTTSTSVEVPASGRVTGTTSLRSKSSHL